MLKGMKGLAGGPGIRKAGLRPGLPEPESGLPLLPRYLMLIKSRERQILCRPQAYVPVGSVNGDSEVLRMIQSLWKPYVTQI